MFILVIVLWVLLCVLVGNVSLLLLSHQLTRNRRFVHEFPLDAFNIPLPLLVVGAPISGNEGPDSRPSKWFHDIEIIGVWRVEILLPYEIVIWIGHCKHSLVCHGLRSCISLEMSFNFVLDLLVHNVNISVGLFQKK